MWGLWETAFCAVFHRIHALFVLASLEFGRTDLPEGRVSASLVIEPFDVIEQLHLRLTVAVEALAELALDRREKALHDGVVPAIPTPAHAADDAARLEDVLIVFARVRAALVGVMPQPDVRTSAFERHLQGFDSDMPVVHCADGPPDDEPREQIQDRREVELAAAAAPDDELGRIADLSLQGTRY